MSFEPKTQAFNSSISSVTIGTGDKAVTLGGINVLPFYAFDAPITNAPKIGVEITDHIKRYFEKGGYSVISVTKGDKREAVVDLKELYRGAVGD